MSEEEKQTKTEHRFDDLMDEMKEEKAEQAERNEADSWGLDTKGSMLRGIFVSAERKTNQYGYGYELLVRDTDTGVLVYVWAMRKTLKQGVKTAAPAVGSEIVFLNNGLQEGKEGRNDWWWYQVRSTNKNPEYWDAPGKPSLEEIEDSIATADKARQKEAVKSYTPDEAPF